MVRLDCYFCEKMLLVRRLLETYWSSPMDPLILPMLIRLRLETLPAHSLKQGPSRSEPLFAVIARWEQSQMMLAMQLIARVPQILPPLVLTGPDR
jgi:hypothetical protein